MDGRLRSLQPDLKIIGGLGRTDLMHKCIQTHFAIDSSRFNSLSVLKLALVHVLWMDLDQGRDPQYP